MYVWGTNGGNVPRSFSCQYGPTLGIVTVFRLSWTQGMTGTNCTGGNGANSVSTLAGAMTNVTVNEGGLLQGWYPGAGTHGASCALGTTAITATHDITVTCVQGCTSQSAVQMSIDSVTAHDVAGAGDVPPYPTDYYPGGQPGDALPVPCITESPAYQPVDTYANFDGNCSSNKIGTTKTWVFTGSPTTSGSGLSKQAKWSTAGDYTVTLKLTLNGVDYSTSITYCIGTASDCASSTGTEADDTDCPTGVGWINPLSIGSILRCLFIPTDFGSDWETLQTGAESNYPLGPVIFVTTTVTDGFTAFSDGTDYYNTHEFTDCTLGPDTDFGGVLPDPVRIPVIPNVGREDDCASGLGGGVIAQDNDAQGSFDAITNVTKPASTALFYVFGIFALYRIVTGAMGSRDSTGSSGGDEE